MTSPWLDAHILLHHPTVRTCSSLKHWPLYILAGLPGLHSGSLVDSQPRKEFCEALNNKKPMARHVNHNNLDIDWNPSSQQRISSVDSSIVRKPHCNFLESHIWKYYFPQPCCLSSTCKSQLLSTVVRMCTNRKHQHGICRCCKSNPTTMPRYQNRLSTQPLCRHVSIRSCPAGALRQGEVKGRLIWKVVMPPAPADKGRALTFKETRCFNPYLRVLCSAKSGFILGVFFGLPHTLVDPPPSIGLDLRAIPTWRYWCDRQ